MCGMHDSGFFEQKAITRAMVAATGFLHAARARNAEFRFPHSIALC
jgi:hypothetical protein